MEKETNQFIILSVFVVQKLAYETGFDRMRESFIDNRLVYLI